MTRNDREALTLAMSKAAEDPLRRDQIAAMMDDQPWEEVAAFCAAVCQTQRIEVFSRGRCRRVVATPSFIPTRQRESCWSRCSISVSRAGIRRRWRPSRGEARDGEMILSDRQRWIVTTAAEQLPPEKLPAFLSRLAGYLRHRINVSDDDVADACANAKQGLMQNTGTAA